MTSAQKDQNMYQYFTNEVRDDIIKYFNQNPISHEVGQKKNFIIYMCVKFCETNSSHVNFSLIQQYAEKLDGYYEVRKENWMTYQYIKDDTTKILNFFQHITETTDNPTYLEVSWDASGCMAFYTNQESTNI